MGAPCCHQAPWGPPGEARPSLRAANVSASGVQDHRPFPGHWARQPGWTSNPGRGDGLHPSPTESAPRRTQGCVLSSLTFRKSPSLPVPGIRAPHPLIRVLVQTEAEHWKDRVHRTEPQASMSSQPSFGEARLLGLAWSSPCLLFQTPGTCFSSLKVPLLPGLSSCQALYLE